MAERLPLPHRIARFLVLDVSRHRYPPVWVAAADLFAAMNTIPGTHARGFVTARVGP